MIIGRRRMELGIHELIQLPTIKFKYFVKVRLLDPRLQSESGTVGFGAFKVRTTDLSLED